MKRKIKYLSNAELSAFCQQIAMILNAGLPTYYGISILKDEAVDEQTEQLLEKIFIPMEKGSTLYSAIRQAECFPPYVVNMVQIGEETGRLEEVLLSLSSYYEREDTIRSNIKGAVAYPFVLTLMMLSVIIVMVTKVLPVFATVYNQLGSELTGTAAVLMKISTVINKYLFVLIILFGLILVTGLILYRTDLGKVLFQGREFAMSIAASRFANSMFLALSSGLDTDKGLELASELVNNPYMQARIDNCKNDIAHGESFANALLHAGVFSKMYSSWIAIGSKTGSLDDIMKHICEAYEADTNERLDHFISTLEPTLVIVLCLFIGLILVSFLLPLLGIMSSIG